MSTTDQVDVCVVGGGIVGRFTALNLAQNGLFVRMIDENYAGSSRFNIGEVTLMDHDERLDELLALTMKKWQESGKSYGKDLGIAPRGSVHLAITGAAAQQLELTAERDKSKGFPEEYYATPEELAEKLGKVRLGKTIKAGRIVASDAVIDTRMTIDGLHQLLVTSGVKIWGGDQANNFITDDEGNVKGVRLRNGDECLARTTLICAGAKGSRLLAKVGANVPLRPARCNIAYVTPNGRLPDQLMVHRENFGHLMAKTMASGQVMLAYDGIMDQRQATFSKEADDETVSWMMERIGELFPALYNAKLEKKFAIINGVTPDFLPALGPYGSIKGLHIAVGLNGRSYALAAGVADILTKLALGKACPIDMTPFTADRFTTGTWQPVDMSAALKPLPAPQTSDNSS